MALDIQSIIRDWWNLYQVDPRSSFDRIISGMRKGLYSSSGEMKYPGGVTQEIVTSQQQTGSCQYWVNGLSAPCKNWDHATRRCIFEFENEEDKPTGYGIGSCDNLGRRGWCSKYDPSKEDNLDEYVCILPCIEKSGRGKQITTEDNTISYRPFTPDEIQGYNPDENGVGRCDGWGLGRSDRQSSFSSLEELYKYTPICKHYRPHQMGFGAIQPHPYPGSEAPGKPFDPSVNYIPETLAELHDGSASDPLIIMPKILPFIFQIYNARAMYQQCAHWKHHRPAFFEITTETDVSLQNIQLNDEVRCEYYDQASSPASPFVTEEDRWADVPWMVQSVIAKYGGIICNGAKPECPCYTGKWIYCTDNNMRDGMRITADQMFELRFWTSNWASQAEYEEYYRVKPGRTVEGVADETTADIYTFTKWLKLDAGDPNDSIMQGYRHSMCMPAPLHMKEFIPSEYITKELLEYPKLNEYTGTNILNDKVIFPTLVRALEDPDAFVPDIEVIYPYSTLDPWNVEICQQNEDLADFCVHNTTLMENPYISVVGRSKYDREMYVVNAALMESSSETVKAFEYMDDYIRASKIKSGPLYLWIDFNQRIDKLISYCDEKSQGFTTGTTNDVGFFTINVELKCNDFNELYVICKYNTDENYPEYIFRKLKVKSIYWAGIIYQTTMTHSHFSGAGSNAFPEAFTPPANFTAEVVNTTGTVGSVIPLYFHQRKSLFSTKSYYGYCLNEYEIEENDVEFWTQVGPTGYVWAELDNIDLSYLWDFEVTEVYMEVRTTTDSDGNATRSQRINLCGAADSSKIDDITINLTQVDVSRRNIPPNAVLFKAPTAMGFFPEDWKLVVKYKYRILETSLAGEGGTTIWPAYINSTFGVVKFRSAPYTINHEAGVNAFSVAGPSAANAATLRIMAFLTDEYGRIQAAAATKLLVQGYVLGCLNVEIEYIYAAPAKAYQLQPVSGFATWTGPPKAIMIDRDGGFHYNRAPCGDHDCDPRDCVGPMWYPYNSCADKVFYNFYTPAGHCLLPQTEGEEEIEKIGVGAWRYQLAPEYDAWNEPGGNWAASCGAQWLYFYSKADKESNIFVGYAAKVIGRAYINYVTNDYVLPPFGLTNRAYIERYVSRDFHPFLDPSGTFPRANAKYMPLVFDTEDLSSNPDPFGGQSFDGGTINYFSMMNNYLATYVDESITEGRYRFDDIINTHEQGGCSYPEDVVQIGDDAAVVVRYGFKNSSHVWAWREYWKPIERNISDEVKFDFIDLYRPSYYVDTLKKEYRLITSEGFHTLVFEPPQGATNTGDDTTAVYPSISLDGAHPRYFNIIYDDYTEGYADWKDESSTGEEGSSDGSNIYEQANNGSDTNGFSFDFDLQWVHSFNCIFDGDASSEPNEDRRLFLGLSPYTYERLYGYYNRGLNIYIPRNKLKFLPMSITYASSPDSSLETEDSYIGYWEIGGEFGLAPVEIVIEGSYGTKVYEDGSKTWYSQPYVRVAESTNDATYSSEETIPDWPEGKTVGFSKYISGVNVPNTLKKYEISLELERDPNRFTKNLNYFMVKLDAFSGEELNITKFEVKLGKYTRAEERILVWERKYLAGQASLTAPNADGPDTVHYRSHQRDNEHSGQFYPISDNTMDSPRTSGAGGVISKTTMVNFKEQQEADEEISVSMDNLKQVEQDAQKEEYELATNLESYDVLDFTAIVHPALSAWLEKINIETFSIPSALQLTYNKILWNVSKYPAWLKQDADFWPLGGHLFEWSDKIFRTKCYVTGPIQDVFEARFVHYNHGWKEDILPTAAAFAGWGKTDYYNGVLWAQASQGKEPSTPDLVTGAMNGIIGGGDV